MIVRSHCFTRRAPALTSCLLRPTVATRSGRGASLSSMAASQDVKLDRAVFNPTLYARLRSFWFAGLTPESRVVNPETAQRWFGQGLTPEEKAAFDADCKSNFGSALETISPDKLRLPQFKSYAEDLANAEAISGPFIAEVRNANRRDPKEAAETLMSLCLLLDQMPRNIYRDINELPLVYKHYDRLTWTLFRKSLELTPNPVEHPVYALKPVYLMWFMLPLMHSEDPESHRMNQQLQTIVETRLKAAGDDEAVEMWQSSKNAGKTHKDLIDQYGRYPHRNECLGRETTSNETEYLKSGDTFGVKQGAKESN